MKMTEPKTNMTTLNPLSLASRNAPLQTQSPATPPSPRLLMHIVQTVVGQISEDGLVPVAAASRGLAFQPRSLLALLTYCYATGTYASQEVEAALRQDSLLRFLCADELPDWHTLRRFRRHNRDVLQQCLEETLASAAQEQGFRTEQGRGVSSGLLNERAFGHPAAEEAATRIEQAVWCDSVALE
jgi:transposase